MPARTRTRNKDASLKTYYSKKVPKQLYFPHRRKTVCEKPSNTQYEPEMRQITFLPEKRRQSGGNVVFDSDDEGEEEMLEEDIEEDRVKIESEPESEIEIEQSVVQRGARRGKKRNSDIMQKDSETDDKTLRPTPKRKRKATAPKKRDTSIVKLEPDDDTVASPSESERKGIRQRHRRQSTMTQLVNGRRPIPDMEEPEFKPIKKCPRTSWGGKAGKKDTEKDKQQRTLTQMLPGLTPLGIESDDDMRENLEDTETQDQDSQAWNDAIQKHLAKQGILRGEEDGQDEPGIFDIEKNYVESEIAMPSHQSRITRPVKNDIDDDDDDDEDEFQPMQIIPASTLRRSRTLRRSSTKENLEHVVVNAAHSPMRKPTKSRFSLLSTPEKSRVREIPSSQSPPDSPLYTQVTPRKTNRSPLKERSGNMNKTTEPTETPPKRKQVTFQEPSKESDPPPPASLRKFKSVIQDSEDEDEDWIEDEPIRKGQDVNTHARTSIQLVDKPALGRDIGADTQAILQQIDQACANVAEDAEWQNRDPSEELGELAISQCHYVVSSELGVHQDGSQMEEVTASLPCQSYESARATIKQEPKHEVDIFNLPLQPPPTSHQKPQATIKMEDSDVPISRDEEFSGPVEYVTFTPPRDSIGPDDILPSTPMVIKDESSGEESEPAPTPPHRSRALPQSKTNPDQPSADLDGGPIQVPRSPSARPETQESHSSKAEQQLQTEYYSYSQYRRVDPSSSMHVAHDPFSYRATPFPPHEQAPLMHSNQLSQATTVDYTQPSPQTTPRKARSQPIVGANTTPHGKLSSQPIISPDKPLPLVIPSSFPSPGRAGIDDWSSPVTSTKGNGYDMSQIGRTSIEDFSIPPPPPDGWDD